VAQVKKREPAILDNALDFGQSDLSGIVIFPGASSDEPEVIDAEYNSVEHRPITGIEGTIDEGVVTLQPTVNLARGRPTGLSQVPLCRRSAQCGSFLGGLYPDGPVGAIVENFAILSMDHKLAGVLLLCRVLSSSDRAARCVGKTLTEPPAFLTAQTPSER
jgi:hypothetical protein